MNQALARESEQRDDGAPSVPIRDNETELVKRLREVIAEADSLAAFSRRSQVSESNLRAYLNRGVRPGLDHFIAIAETGGVNKEWLATGRGPKRGSDASKVEEVDLVRLQRTLAAVEQGMRAINRTLPPPKYAELVAAAYQLMGAPATSSAAVVQFIKAAA